MIRSNAHTPKGLPTREAALAELKALRRDFLAWISSPHCAGVPAALMTYDIRDSYLRAVISQHDKQLAMA